MRAALRAIDCYQISDIAAWRPGGPDFGIMVQLLVGPAEGPGEESFDVTVCTGGWLAARAVSGPVDARHHTVVDSFNWPALRRHFRKRVEACTGKDWSEVAAKVARIGHWEFEDYRPLESST